MTDESGLVRGALNNRPLTTLIIALTAATFLYVAVLTPNRFGAYHDDGIYVATAKALATGQGYRIISLPDEPAQTKYPPFYPFLLSLIWRASPDFPGNLTLMTLLSPAAALGFLIMTWRYLLRYAYANQWQASIVVAMTALNWRTMILGTSIYSEMAYAALSVSALHMAERHEKSGRTWVTGSALGVLTGLAFITRSSGFALMVAVVVYYALRKEWRRLALPLFVATLFVAAWGVWCYANRNPVEGLNTAYYTNYLGHLNQGVSDLQAQSGSSRLAILVNNAVENLVGGVLISAPLVCCGLSYNAFAPFSGFVLGVAIFAAFLSLVLIATGFGRTLARRVRLLHIYLAACLGMYLLWLPGVSYDRFLMPLLPFLLLFLVCELGVLTSMAQKGVASREASGRIGCGLVSIVLLLVAGLTVYGYGSGLYSSFVSLNSSAARAADDAEAFSWLAEHSRASDVLVCYRDPKYFLYTGHKAVRSFPMTEGYSWEEDPASMDKLTSAVFRIIDEAGARYVVTTATDFELEDRPEQHRRTFAKLIEQQPQTFELVFESAEGGVKIYRTKKESS